MTDDFIVANPVFPCVCGHAITAHGSREEVDYRWEWDEDHQEEVEVADEYDVPYCYECDEGCYFVEMTNLEYLEHKSGNNKR